jgi:hypothetical protein
MGAQIIGVTKGSLLVPARSIQGFGDSFPWRLVARVLQAVANAVAVRSPHNTEA